MYLVECITNRIERVCLDLRHGECLSALLPPPQSILVSAGCNVLYEHSMLEKKSESTATPLWTGVSSTALIERYAGSNDGKTSSFRPGSSEELDDNIHVVLTPFVEHQAKHRGINKRSFTFT